MSELLKALEAKDSNKLLDALNAKDFDPVAVSDADIAAAKQLLVDTLVETQAQVVAKAIAPTEKVKEAIHRADAGIGMLTGIETEREAATAEILALLDNAGVGDAPTDIVDTVADTDTATDTDAEAADPGAETLEPELVTASRFELPKPTRRVSAAGMQTQADPAATAPTGSTVSLYTRRPDKLPAGEVTEPVTASRIARDGDTAFGNTGAKTMFGVIVERNPLAVPVDQANIGASIHAAAENWRTDRSGRTVALNKARTVRDVVTASCVAPPVPMFDTAGPCPMTLLSDDLPVVTSTAPINYIPRREVNPQDIPVSVGIKTQTDHNNEAGQPYKQCVEMCPPDGIPFEPTASWYCVSSNPFTNLTYPQASESAVARLREYARLAREYWLFERMSDPSGANPLVIKPAVPTGQFGSAIDVIQWVDEAADQLTQTTGCVPDVVTMSTSALHSMVHDVQRRNGQNIADALEQVLGGLQLLDGRMLRLYTYAPLFWYNGSAATTTNGFPFVPPQLTTGGVLGGRCETRIFLGYSDGLLRVDHGGITMSADNTAANTSSALFENIDSMNVVRPQAVLDVPLNATGASGAMIAAAACV